MSTRVERGSAPAADDRAFFGHPRGLETLFFTEMWERFSFYGLRAILVLYLISAPDQGGVGMDPATANSLYAVYSSSVYLLALPGGWIADRLAGPRRTVLIGGILIALGHYSMAVPVLGMLYVGLVLIAVGTGLLKPNMSSMVGGLYSDQDERRDAGFSLYYMGINVGAFAAPLVVGWLGEDVNWQLGFGCAAVGMTIALVQYVIGGRHLGTVGIAAPDPASAQTRSRMFRIAGLVVGVAAVLIAIDVALGAFDLDHIINAFTLIAVVIPAIYFWRIVRNPSLTTDDRRHMKAFVWLFLAGALFWMIYDQAGSVLNEFANDQTNRDVFGFTFPASWYQSVNPALILVLAPFFAWLWVFLGQRQPSTPIKFAMGLVLVGLSFCLMTAAVATVAGGGLASPWWLVLVYLVQTCGELTLSPVGLSVSTKLAPAAFVSQVVGVWFLATAVGDAVGAQMVKLYGVWPAEAYFLSLGLLAIAAGILLALGARLIRKLMRPLR